MAPATTVTTAPAAATAGRTATTAPASANVNNVIASQESQNPAAERALAQAFQNRYTLSGVPKTTGNLSIGSGVNLLTRLYSTRAARLADISVALGDYMNATGSINHPALIKIQQEMAANDILNNLTKSLFEKSQQATSTWTQMRV